jgi:hypothetical protein
MEDLYRELLARPTVDIRDPAQVELWTRTLNIYTADLVEAVARVGHASGAVLEDVLRARAARRGG